ncbi:MAG: PTS sugar transporter subunit IIA [Chlorobiaceae bacterium]|nr:PTS sugar transporter subunit IIA [Chlorobiaceae bacterium]
MKLEALLSEKYVALDLEAETKSQVIERMLALVAGSALVTDPARLSEDVWKREREMSTGIGKNIGLPHAKTAAVTSPVVAMATLRDEIEFDSIDGQPVRLVFLLATPDSMLAEHLKLLGRITRIAGRDEVRQKILQASTTLEVLELMRDEEKDLPQI